jgi:hypothetical protein
MDMCVHRGYGARVQALVVDEEHVVVRMPAVLVTPRELERDDVADDAQPLEPLPGRTSRDPFPSGTLGLYKLGEAAVSLKAGWSDASRGRAVFWLP